MRKGFIITAIFLVAAYIVMVFWHPHLWWIGLIILPLLVLGLVDYFQESNNIRRTYPLLGRITNLLASGNTVPDSSVLPIRYPVLTRIAGVDWEGRCRYVNDELIPASFELTGGIRFDINENIVNMNSFVAFPNGKSREIEMRYVKFFCDPPSIFCRVPTHANDPDPDNQSN